MDKKIKQSAAVRIFKKSAQLLSKSDFFYFFGFLALREIEAPFVLFFVHNDFSHFLVLFQDKVGCCGEDISERSEPLGNKQGNFLDVRPLYGYGRNGAGRGPKQRRQCQ